MCTQIVSGESTIKEKKMLFLCVIHGHKDLSNKSFLLSTSQAWLLSLTYYLTVFSVMSVISPPPVWHPNFQVQPEYHLYDPSNSKALPPNA